MEVILLFVKWYRIIVVLFKTNLVVACCNLNILRKYVIEKNYYPRKKLSRQKHLFDISSISEFQKFCILLATFKYAFSRQKTNTISSAMRNTELIVTHLRHILFETCKMLHKWSFNNLGSVLLEISIYLFVCVYVCGNHSVFVQDKIDKKYWMNGKLGNLNLKTIWVILYAVLESRGVDYYWISFEVKLWRAETK